MKDLFNKYLQGNCTESEFEQLLSWIKNESQSIAGKALIKEIWDEFEPEAGANHRMKYNRILDKIHHQINIKQYSSLIKTKEISFKSRVLSIVTRAAAILLLPVLLLLVFTNLPDKYRYAENSNDLEIQAPAGSQMHLELGDGTKVWLNHGSKLKYPYRFTGKTRKVMLTGEAYFEVAHNKRIPFIVETSQIDVKATGTAFNVNAYPGDDRIETTLIEGKVILYKKNANREIRSMSPDECVRFYPQTNTYSIDSNNTEKYVSWKDGLLIFKNDPMESIAKKLGRWYNIEVVFTDEKVKEYTYTATFADETLPQVLELMGMATPLSYELTSGKKLADGSFSKQKLLIGLKKNKI